MYLLFFQNVVGSDIAELLVGNKDGSGGRSVEDIIGGGSEDQDDTVQDEDLGSSKKVPEAKATEKFCELLLYGHKKDALGKLKGWQNDDLSIANLVT